jgi:hypothetical protein
MSGRSEDRERIGMLAGAVTPATGGGDAAAGRLAGATGLARTAGWLLVGGGAGLVLSVCMPWFTVVGGSAELPVGSFLVCGAAGAVVGSLGVSVLRSRATRRVMATLWVLAAAAAFMAVNLFLGANDVQQQSGGAESPAFGFFLAMLALLSTVAGTVSLQVTRRRARPGGGAG